MVVCSRQCSEKTSSNACSRSKGQVCTDEWSIHSKALRIVHVEQCVGGGERSNVAKKISAGKEPKVRGCLVAEGR